MQMVAGKPLDLLVVGGGILGAGTVRDAAMRGLRVALVEQYDFAYGTSSRSSRLLHGGLRYLAQGRVGLVREAGREKAILAAIAPHLAAPLAFVFPTYHGTEWPRWQLSLGVRVYDALCGVKGAPNSATMSREQTVALLPWLKQEGLTGSVRYGDALTNDARLVIDTLRSAARHGAVLLNYTKMVHARRDDGRWICRLRDAEGGRDWEVVAAAVVNVTGPWAMQLEQSAIKLRLTKGVHLMIDRSRLPVPDAVVMAEGKRILFAIPYGQRVILGTTDTDYAGRIEEVRAEPEDTAYILRVTNQTFPKAGIGPADVIANWAGLRPLIAKRDGSPSDISRRHLIIGRGDGWFDVAGGKLTTYRFIAEQTVDRVARLLGRAVAPCRTHLESLVSEQEAIGFSGIEPPAVELGVVEHFCRNEWALHLEDVMDRRGRWSTYSMDAEAIAQKVAEMMAGICGWTTQRKEQELSRVSVTQSTRR